MSFFQKIGNALSRFMYGRNGFDQLSLALVLLELAVYVISVLLGGTAGTVLYILCLLTWGVILWRMFSKNLEKRRRENAWFLNRWNPIVRRFQDFDRRRKDKNHKYFRCTCGAYCRVPRGKGRIEITCPKCRRKFQCKS